MYSLSIQSTRENTEKVMLLVYEHISWGWEERNARTIIIHFSSIKQAGDFNELVQRVCPDCSFEIKPVQDKDWTEDWKQYFTPVQINETFIILPEWLENTPSSLIKIIITPKMAFGTGHHPTTSLCLKTLASLFNKGMLNKECRFLDLGSGSGILGIAGAKLGMSGIGLDIDGSAVDNASENISLNNVEDRFLVRRDDITSITISEKFNLVFANILASTLRNLAGRISSLLHGKSYCLILSGILENQTENVASAYEELGLGTPLIRHEGEWSALIWTHEQRR